MNPAENADYIRLEEFRNRTTIPMIQDTEALNLWKFYNGGTDDMFIFDKYK